MPQTRGSNADPLSASPKRAKHVGFAPRHTDGEAEAETDDHSDTDNSSSEEEVENVKSASAKTRTKTKPDAASEQDLRELFTVVDKATTGGKLRKVYRTACDECSSRELDCAYEANKQSCGFCNRKHRGCKRGGVPVSNLMKKLATLTSNSSKSTSPNTPENAVSPFQRERSQRQIKPTGDTSIPRTPASTAPKASSKTAAQSSSGSTRSATLDDASSPSASVSRPPGGRVSGVILPLPNENGAKPSSSAVAPSSSSNSASTAVASSSGANKRSSTSASAPAKNAQEAGTGQKRKLRPVLKSLTGPSSSFTSQSDDDVDEPAAKRRKQEAKRTASAPATNKKATTASASASKSTPARAAAKVRSADKSQPEPSKRPPKRTQPQDRAASSMSPPPPPLPPPRNQPKRSGAPKVQSSSPGKESMTKLNAMFESYKNLDRLVDSLNDLMSMGDMTEEQTDEVKSMRRKLRGMKEQMRGWT